jgi:hypothetical protein
LFKIFIIQVKMLKYVFWSSTRYYFFSLVVNPVLSKIILSAIFIDTNIRQYVQKVTFVIKTLLITIFISNQFQNCVFIPYFVILSFNII